MSARRQATALFWGLGATALIVSGGVLGELASGSVSLRMGWQTIRLCCEQVLAWCLSLLGGTGFVLPGLGIALFAGSWLWALGRAGRTIFRLRDDLSGLIVDKIPEALARLAEEAGLAGQLRLFVSPAKQAFTAGFLRPRVYLSTSLLEALDREEILAVLFHEAHHLVRRDPLRIFLATILKDAFWYLPVVRALWREFTEAKEKAADDAAARAGEIPLAGALLKLAAGNHAAAPAQVPAFHGPSIEERVRRLLAPGTDRSPRPAWRSVAASLLIAVSLLGSVAAPSWSSSTTDSCTMAHCPMPHAGELSGAECRHHCEGHAH